MDIVQSVAQYVICATIMVPQMAMTDLIVFDKDGVILDLEATWLPVARAVAHYTVSRFPDDCDSDIGVKDLLAAIGVNDESGLIDSQGIFAAGSFADIRSCWQQILPKNMIRLDQDKKYQTDVKGLLTLHRSNQTVPKGDVETPLRKLHKEGYILAILTNDSADSARSNLNALGLLDLFCVVIGADSGYGSKPDPYGFLQCCNVAGVRPAVSIMVGDTMADYGAAVAAGAGDFICVADHFESWAHTDLKRDRFIRRLDQLPALMAKQELDKTAPKRVRT